MKKCFKLCAIFFFIFSTSCSDNNDENSKASLDNLVVSTLKKDLNLFLKKTDLSEIKGEKSEEIYFKQKYQEVFKERANINIFEDALKELDIKKSKISKGITSKDITSLSDGCLEIILMSETPEEALNGLEQRSNNEMLSLEERIESVTLYEVIIFIEGNKLYFEQQQLDTLKGRGSWWTRWGKCSASILGGAVTGATTLGLAGAAVGTVALPVVGTVSAGLVGAIGGGIGGALTGAAAGC